MMKIFLLLNHIYQYITTKIYIKSSKSIIPADVATDPLISAFHVV